MKPSKFIRKSKYYKSLKEGGGSSTFIGETEHYFMSYKREPDDPMIHHRGPVFSVYSKREDDDYTHSSGVTICQRGVDCWNHGVGIDESWDQEFFFYLKLGTEISKWLRIIKTKSGKFPKSEVKKIKRWVQFQI